MDTGDEEPELKDGLQLTEFGVVNTLTEDMPNWAKKALEPGQTKPVEVRDSGDQGDNFQAHPSDSTVGSLLRDNSAENKAGTEAQANGRKAQEPESTMQNLMYGEKTEDVTDSKDAEVKSLANTLSKEAEYLKVTEKSPLKNMPKIKSPLKGPIKKTPTKQHIKLVEGHHATSESTTESQAKSTIKVDDARNVSKESEETEMKSSIKTGGKMHATQESEPQEAPKASVKCSGGATKETEEQEERKHLKTFEGVHAGVESKEVVVKPHLKTNAEFNALKESVEAAPKVYKPSIYGHISEISREEFSIIAPKMKRRDEMYATKQSELFDREITVKSGRRRVKGQDVNKVTMFNEDETDAGASQWVSLKKREGMHMSKESEYVDVDAYRLERFKERNVHGHAADSSVQKLLYGGRFGSQEKEKEEEGTDVATVTELAFWSESEMEKYRDNYDLLDCAPEVDLLSSVPAVGALHGLTDLELDDDVSAHQYVSLPSLLNRSITAPLSVQIRLVNECMISHFMGELDVESHFKALRRFLLMKDGEFSQSLADQLFEKLGSSPRPHEVLNPVFLNNVLNRALRSSIKGDHPLTQNLSFILRYLPQVLQINAPNSLDCLELTYKVDWPLNIVITDKCLAKYGHVFTLMLQLKRTVWTLKDIWHQLKRDAMMSKASSGVQFRQLQLYRHEMQHFVKVMQGYLANQVIHASWGEFQETLGHVQSLDDLHNKHVDYINKCLFR